MNDKMDQSLGSEFKNQNAFKGYSACFINIFFGLFICFLTCQKDGFQEVSRFESDSGYAGGLYHTLNEIYEQLNTLKQDYPDDVRLYIIGWSAKKHRPIPMMRLTLNHQDPSDDAFLFVSGTHGDEAAAVEALCYAMGNVLRLNSEDHQLLVGRKITVDFIPVHNPDGYVDNERENGYSVDLNRNFPFGYVQNALEGENRALVDLINKHHYRASLFFHSANDQKYENLVRIPIELGRGKIKIDEEKEKTLWDLAHLIEDAGNRSNPKIPWHISRKMVDASGIASDWCMGTFVEKSQMDLNKRPCRNPHPSVTVELCFPKQPMDPNRLQQEKEEVFHIIWDVLLNF